ncbi:hypothetical protein PB01_06785 [Psychrobacillus glaciei]|uniref:Uncharacterized protein n=1 Tax=Psychrobacillus glaciei TaxID=2283160 RepID=A0A5J6SKP8_9BACI|nr:hypothetical protein [Psychrobacillus glaciei]QFF98556.1 hypothetical protein PB01_06785 [Psychrobacillus glaciei]
MVGTIISNFWTALFAFSIYFFSTYPFLDAKNILFNASIIAITVFLITFLARAIISFVMEDHFETEQVEFSLMHEKEFDKAPSSEEYAEIVKSMLNEGG